jgi:hypothetical protein
MDNATLTIGRGVGVGDWGSGNWKVDVDVPEAVEVAVPDLDVVAEELGKELDDVEGDELEEELAAAEKVGIEGIAEALADELLVAEDDANALDEAMEVWLTELLDVGVELGAALMDARGEELEEEVG